MGLQKKLLEEQSRPPDEPYPDGLETRALYRGAVSDAELTLLIRFYLEGWSQRELAAELGISENACKLRIKRAKQRLRSALEEDGSAGAEERRGERR